MVSFVKTYVPLTVKCQGSRHSFQSCSELKIFPNERTPKKHFFKTNSERTTFVNSKNQKRFQELMLKLILKPTLIQILNLNTTVRFIKPALAVIRFGKITMIYCTMMGKY